MQVASASRELQRSLRLRRRVPPSARIAVGCRRERPTTKPPSSVASRRTSSTLDVSQDFPKPARAGWWNSIIGHQHATVRTSVAQPRRYRRVRSPHPAGQPRRAAIQGPRHDSLPCAEKSRQRPALILRPFRLIGDRARRISRKYRCARSLFSGCVLPAIAPVIDLRHSPPPDASTSGYLLAARGGPCAAFIGACCSPSRAITVLRALQRRTVRSPDIVVVGIQVTRELGPVLAGLMLAGRVGAAHRRPDRRHARDRSRSTRCRRPLEPTR